MATNNDDNLDAISARVYDPSSAVSHDNERPDPDHTGVTAARSTSRLSAAGCSTAVNQEAPSPITATGRPVSPTRATQRV